MVFEVALGGDLESFWDHLVRLLGSLGYFLVTFWVLLGALRHALSASESSLALLE